jgi:hypothetical protein
MGTIQVVKEPANVNDFEYHATYLYQGLLEEYLHVENRLATLFRM